MDQSERSSAGEHAIESCIKAIHAGCLPNRAGNVADYIPELAGVDPDPFGIAIATVGGKLWSCGDAEAEFTLQSISKAFVYCLALELLGRERVLAQVGVEPSGDAFNAIVFDRTRTGRSIRWSMPARSRSRPAWYEAPARTLWTPSRRLSEAAGRSLHLDAVYRSESRQAIATARSPICC